MLYNYCNKIFCMRDKSKRTRDRFLVVCSKWLNQELMLPSEVHVLEITAHFGCLKMSFQCSSDRHKPSEGCFCLRVAIHRPKESVVRPQNRIQHI